MKLKIKATTAWDDLTDNQLFKLMLLLNSKIKGIAFDWKAFTILVNPKWSYLITKAKLVIIKANVLSSEIKPNLAFIYGSNGRTKFPVIKNDYFSPLEKITNLTIAEMAFADDLHIKYRNTNNTEYLKYLAATLYVKNQQPRPPFDKNDLPSKVIHFDNIPIAKLLAVEFAFAGSKEYIAQRFRKAFPVTPKDKINPNAKPPKGSSLPNLILSLSGGKFGTFDQTSKTNCYTFFAEFENILKQQTNG